VLKARNGAIGFAEDNALKSNVHQAVLLKRPELETIASKIINSRKLNELKQGRGSVLVFLLLGLWLFGLPKPVTSLSSLI